MSYYYPINAKQVHPRRNKGGGRKGKEGRKTENGLSEPENTRLLNK